MPPRLPSLLRPPILFAHRGASAHARENTLDAFTLAQRLGATGLESDVWLTADGVAVLDHDGVVGGRLRRRRIRSLPRADLAAHIPTLAELYEACGTDYQLSLDLKDPDAIDAVLAAARAAGDHAEARLWLCHDELERLTSWRARSETARLVNSTTLKRMDESPERRAARLYEQGVDAVCLPAEDWSGGLAALFHRFGRFALGWGAQLERVIFELLDSGLDGIYSDHVDRLTAAASRAGYPPKVTG